MKKGYIKPESRLLVFNIKENIAASGYGNSEISGAAVIRFTQVIDGCRGFYSGVQSAKVTTPGNSFSDYYTELVEYGADVYFSCFKYIF